MALKRRGLTAILSILAIFFFYFTSDSSTVADCEKRSSSSKAHLLASASSSLLKRQYGASTGAAGHGHPTCSLPPGLRLAIYQFRPYHSEIFGFILEYAKRCGHTVTVYHSVSTASNALPMYQKLYGTGSGAGMMTVSEPGFFNGEHLDYHAVFFSTPDDYLPEEFRMPQAHRFIYCAHITVPGFIKRWQLLRLHMSPLVGLPYSLPVYAADAPVPAGSRDKTIVMVGAIFDGENIDTGELFEIAEGATKLGYKFVLFTRHIKSDRPVPDTIVVKQDAPTEELYSAARGASFIISFASFDSWYHTDRVTGALPLSISVATPLLTRSRMADIYGLSEEGTGSLAAENATELISALGSVSPQRYASMVAAVEGYRSRTVNHNIKAIDDVMLHVPAVNELVPGTPVQPLSPKFASRGIPWTSP